MYNVGWNVHERRALICPRGQQQATGCRSAAGRGGREGEREGDEWRRQGGLFLTYYEIYFLYIYFIFFIYIKLTHPALESEKFLYFIHLKNKNYRHGKKQNTESEQYCTHLHTHCVFEVHIQC